MGWTPARSSFTNLADPFPERVARLRARRVQLLGRTTLSRQALPARWLRRTRLAIVRRKHGQRRVRRPAHEPAGNFVHIARSRLLRQASR